MNAICALCDALVGYGDVYEHYELRHPERFRGDWDLACWPDGEQVLVVADGYEDDWAWFAS